MGDECFLSLSCYYDYSSILQGWAVSIGLHEMMSKQILQGSLYLYSSYLLSKYD